MAVSFNEVPSNWPLPLFWAEVDPSKAGGVIISDRALLWGIKLAGGSAAVNVPVPVGSDAQGAALFGAGSMAALMLSAFRRRNTTGEVWVLPLAEPAAGVAASGTIAVTAAPTAAGTIPLYIAGQSVPVLVTASDTTAQVATKIAAAIAAKTTLPVTGVASTSTVTLTAKWKGLTGNDIRIEHSYRGTQGGEALPASLALTITAMASGTGAPTLDTGIANLGDQEFDHQAFPFTDSASLDAFRDLIKARWAYDRQLYGWGFSAMRGSYADLLTFLATRNDPAISVDMLEVATPTPVWEISALNAAAAAQALNADPARPLQTLLLTGALPAPAPSRFTKGERAALALQGGWTHSVTNDDQIAVEASVTTYKYNSYGVEDRAYRRIETRATLTRVLRELRAIVTSEYPRHKLANDGTRFGPGQAIVTPNTIRARLVAQYRDLEDRGLVENAKAFKEALIVERDGTDPNRVNVLFPPDLVNQLVVFAVLAQFRLQYPTEAAA
ncbi:phage tail sheath C-terminal domain-containing protein [Ancylobacter oerskovii]|uniref:Phage tail sheath C-terminal domain-containing protein n=1 Tax=Ancylobacter oerskovii TaxID=459519 RepID=A0ABW4Z2X8_9HYPH|nr:phage tail sheath C-terminal domain-containing protein [Ancylobacter oerskovii]MBS7546245.1 phage tail sheath subtilisin-like domain-containing protein [Ancylobacter oerskovii]